MIGTTGWDEGELREAVAGAPGNVFAAANFAIGAVLMMRFAAEASKHMQAAEIIEYHHPAKLDKPSGTAARTAAAMDGDVPIHSVRLPGIVADQDVILGDIAPDPDHPPRDDRPHELHARRAARGPPGGRAARVPGVRAREAPVALVSASPTTP